jgi:hypothetical protein
MHAHCILVGEHAPSVSGFLSFTCLEGEHARHAHPYLYLERASLLTLPYLRQLGIWAPALDTIWHARHAG